MGDWWSNFYLSPITQEFKDQQAAKRSIGFLKNMLNNRNKRVKEIRESVQQSPI